MEDLFNWIDKTGLDRIIFATDMDLTLLDKSPDPNKAVHSPSLEADCQELDRLTGGRFFIITGRDVEFVDLEVFKNHKVKISAEYNCMARFDPAKGEQDLVPRPQWKLIDDDLKALLSGQPDWKLRIKPFMRSFHHHLPPEDMDLKQKLRENLQSLVDKLCDETGQMLELIDGGPIFDMKPKGPDKAQALDNILAYCNANYKGTAPLVPIYFGDSPGDLPAAKTAQDNGGIFISVGDDQRVTSVADFHLQSPDECRQLVKRIANTPQSPVAKPTSFIEPTEP